jgi:hypothetical protein
MAGILDTTGIENFYDVAVANDFARQNLFRIISLGGTRFATSELLYMTTTTLPSRDIANIPTPFMGLQFNVPGTASYPGSDAWNVTFRIPQNLSIRRKFEDWSRQIFDDQTSTGDWSIPSGDASNQVIVTLIDKQGNSLRTYTLFGAYCKSIGELTLDITNQGEIITQQATLAYQFWRNNR